jgi:hypothetical protein
MPIKSVFLSLCFIISLNTQAADPQPLSIDNRNELQGYWQVAPQSMGRKMPPGLPIVLAKHKKITIDSKYRINGQGRLQVIALQPVSPDLSPQEIQSLKTFLEFLHFTPGPKNPQGKPVLFEGQENFTAGTRE